MCAGEVAAREQQRDPPAPSAQAGHDVVVDRRRRDRLQRRVRSLGQKARPIVRMAFGKPREEGRIGGQSVERGLAGGGGDRKSTRLLPSLMRNSYAVFCLTKKNSRHIR